MTKKYLPFQPPRLHSMEASGWPVMMRGFLAPRSWLLLAVVLVALVLAVLLTADTTPAQAQQLTTQSRFQVWNSTLTIGAGNTWRGYDGNVGFLPGPSFIFDGVTYEVERLSVTNSDKTLQLVLDKAIPDRLKSSLRLQVGYTEYSLASATLSDLGGVSNDTVTWPDIRQSWPTAGYSLSVSLNAADLWSATLTAKDLGSETILGCNQAVTGAECVSGLTDNSFTYAGTDYQISALSVNDNGTLFLTLNKTIPDSLNSLVLHVNGRRFGLVSGEKATVVDDNANDTREWSETGLSWSANDSIRLRFTERQRLLSWVSFTLATDITTEIYIIDAERSIEPVYVQIDPPLDSESEVMVRIKDRCATGESQDRIAVESVDYFMQLPSVPDKPNTKLLRLPEGVGEVIIWIRAVADRKNEGEEATCFELVPFNDAPYIIPDSHEEGRYPELEFVILDNSIAVPDEADPNRGIIVQPVSAGFVEGGSLTYTVQLKSAPRGNVKIYARVLEPNAPIHTSPSSVVFTPDRWFEAKTFTVTAPPANYGGSFGTVYTITHALRTDPVDENYDSSYWFHGPGIDGQKHIRVRVKDSQEYMGSTGGDLGVVRLPTGLTLALDPARVSESGGWAAITATLDEPAPPGGVSLHLYPSNDSTAVRDVDYTLSASVAIAAGNRSGTALVRVIDDALDEPDERAVIAAYAEVFGFILVDSVTLTITDDDTAGITVSAPSPLTVDEGDSASYSVVLDSQPTADVVITATSGDGAKVSVFPSSITFTPEAWKQPDIFYVDGLADDDSNDESVAVSHRVTSDDPLYRAVIVSTVPVRVSDTTVSGQQGEQTTQGKYADLIAKIREWRDDPCCASNKAHTDRWDRTLLAFGETMGDTTLSPMTAAEAQTYADRGWSRWVEVAAALRELQNQAPTVSSEIADATIVNESGTLEVSLTGVFTDADGDTLTVTAESSDEAKATVSVASGYSTLTVTAKSRGTATITATASDGRGGTVDDSFTVTVKAAPMVSSAIGDMSGLEVGATRDVSLSEVFSDADGDDLTFAFASSDEDVAWAFELLGVLTVLAASDGSTTITVTAQDSDGNTVSDAFDMSVGSTQEQQQQQDPPPNQAPTVTSAIGDATIVNESGTKQVSLSGVFSDADNDSLTITAGSSAETIATVSVASDYATLTVSAKARGTATITVTAKDGNGGTVSDEFTVRVKAAPAVASSIGDISGLEEGSSQDVSLSGVFSDADGDSLTITALSSDENKATVTVAADQSKLTVAGVAEGTATITVTAQDADGNLTSDTFDVAVAPPEAKDEAPTPVANLRCRVDTDQLLFRWDAPEWYGGETYAYDFQLTLPGGGSESGRVIGGPVLYRTGEYQAGGEAGASVKAVYQLPDGSRVTSAEATLTCTVKE